MRPAHKATSIAAMLAIAFSATACGPETKSGGPLKSLADTSLKADLANMATAQEIYIDNHPSARGVAVTTTAGGTASVVGSDDFHASLGNVITVTLDGASGYCISGHNKGAAGANSAAASFVYKSEQDGLQAALGAC